MKKGLLRTLSALMAVSMLLCMSMVAFADGQTYNVTTTYDGTNVTVETEVIGAVPSEQVAFLVEKTTGENTEIIWIDQQTAKADTTAKSTFTAAEGVAVGAKVKVGTTSLAASNFGDAKSIALPEYTVTWEVKGVTENVNVVAVVGDTEDADGSVTTSRTVTFYVAAPANVELVSVNDAAPTIVGDAISYNVNESTKFTFTFAAKNVASAPKPTVPSVVPSGVADTADGKKAASVTATATNASEFGLLVAVKPEEGETSALADITSLDGLGVDSAPVRKYEALGANSFGQFVIQLKDTEGVFFVDNVKYEARVYAKGSELTLGTVFDLN